MTEVHPNFIAFLEGLCAASVTLYPQYGMFIRGPLFGAQVPARTAAASESKSRLQEFFVCVLCNTAVEDPEQGAYVVKKFLALLQECHPDTKAHFELSHAQGWFDGLSIWLTDAKGEAYIYLDWSVS